MCSVTPLGTGRRPATVSAAAAAASTPSAAAAVIALARGIAPRTSGRWRLGAWFHARARCQFVDEGLSGGVPFGQPLAQRLVHGREAGLGALQQLAGEGHEQSAEALALGEPGAVVR